MALQYPDKFLNKWLDSYKLKGWLTNNENDPTESFCKYCKCALPYPES